MLSSGIGIFGNIPVYQPASTAAGYWARLKTSMN